MSDKEYLLAAASERSGDILMFYRKFAEKNPVMLLELPSQEILRFQMRLAKDLECLKVESYGFAAKAIDEIGRPVGVE